jgi:hypothetical protein
MKAPPVLLPGLSPVAALVLGWLIPGGGHAYAGRWGKAILFFVLITGLLVAGVAIGGGAVVLPNRLWFIAQFCAGGPAVALTPISQYFATRAAIDWADRFHEMGTLYTAVAGLLNLLVMMDAYLRLAYPEREAQEDA